MFVGEMGKNKFEGVAPVAGDYRARVYMMRVDARRGKTARYALGIAVGQTSATNEKGPDFADGLTGGPDYWEVTGVDAKDRLNLRATPSPRGAIVSRVTNGASLKNLGCKNTRGQRWRRVENDGRSGWVNGRFLREGAGPR
ncbi:MAG: SH3 domain-containing protein [Methylocystis sp.]|nr:SH3 domain-containing protein [Methylocystis sp.]